MMELWACGFNAWGQLDFERKSIEESRDLDTFKCVLRDQQLDILQMSFSALIVKTSLGLRLAGCPDELIQLCLDKALEPQHFTVAGNEKIVEAKGEIISHFDSLQAFLAGEDTILDLSTDITQIVSNQTTFTALTKSGQVYAWGDGRYEACLGREVSDESPASRPCLIEDLSDLPTGPIRKMSSGGYATAALTEGNDMYVWGGRPGQPKLLEEMSEVPTPVDLDGEDVLDVAVGMNHMIALITGQRLFVVGGGENGQLGLDLKQLTEWKEVKLPLKRKRIVSVHAGYKNSLVIVEDLT